MIFYPRFDVYALRYMMFSDNFFSFYVRTLPYLKITLVYITYIIYFAENQTYNL